MTTTDGHRIAEGDMLRDESHLTGTSPSRRLPNPGADEASAVSTGWFAGTVAIVRAEAGLVERAQAGDPRAFEALVERELDRLHGIARAILGNDADARDATQESLVKAWRELPRLRDPERFDSWVRAILVNSCRQALAGAVASCARSPFLIRARSSRPPPIPKTHPTIGPLPWTRSSVPSNDCRPPTARSSSCTISSSFR
ncbi:MAG: hypothetical protein FIA92_09870 [Chloroflexi bacterium]|nr:hypothetical protein [Chloroflexota bacterium]